MEKKIWDPCPYPILFFHQLPNLPILSCIPCVSSPSRLTHFPVAVPDPECVLAARPTPILAIWQLWNCLPSLGVSLARDRSHLICL